MELSRTRVVAVVGVLSALSFVLTWLRLPFPPFPHYKYDLADVPALIASFAMGPVSGLTVVVVRNVLDAATRGSGVVNPLMNLVASGNLVLWAGFFYMGDHSKRGAVIGLLAGLLTTTALMVPLNLLVTPLFLGVERDVVWRLLLPATIPFNLTKHALTAVATFLLYKRVSALLPHPRPARVAAACPRA